MFHPSLGYNKSDSETETDSESRSTASYSDSDSSNDGQMDAITHWQNAARAALWDYTSAPSDGIVAVGDSGVATPAPTNNGLGMYSTKLQFEQKRVSHVVMVNSLDRDQKVYPLPTQARLKLPRVYKNVERIDIVQVKFFCGLYVISAARKNNTLPIVVGTVQVAVIPDGTYTLAQLLVSVQAALGAAVPALTWTVSYNPVKGRITVAADGPFSLPFQSTLPVYNQESWSEWGLGWNLGFGGQPTDLSGSTVYTADHFPRLIDDYIYLQLNDTEHMNEIDHTSVEKTGVTQDSTGQVAHYFGKLLLNHFGCWAQTFVEAPKTFKPVLGRLERLQFTWADRHGNPIGGVDAASCDWHMTLRITELLEVPVADSSLSKSSNSPTGRADSEIS